MKGRPKKERAEKCEILSFSAPAGTKKILAVLRKNKINKSKLCVEAIAEAFKQYRGETKNI